MSELDIKTMKKIDDLRNKGRSLNIHEHMADMVGLATIYAEDGAFRSAANTLRKLADDLERHATATDNPSH